MHTSAQTAEAPKPPRQVVTRADQLPTRNYTLDRLPSDYLSAPLDDLKPLAAKIEADVIADLQMYDIRDSAELRNHYNDLAAIAQLRQDRPAVPGWTTKVRELHEKTGPRLTSGLLTDLLVQQKQNRHDAAWLRAEVQRRYGAHSRYVRYDIRFQPPLHRFPVGELSPLQQVQVLLIKLNHVNGMRGLTHRKPVRFQIAVHRFQHLHFRSRRRNGYRVVQAGTVAEMPNQPLRRLNPFRCTWGIRQNRIHKRPQQLALPGIGEVALAPHFFQMRTGNFVVTSTGKIILQIRPVRSSEDVGRVAARIDYFLAPEVKNFAPLAPLARGLVIIFIGHPRE
jgi:hypothetical protein